ncbi:MAG: hypothetical protein KatS3mg125_1746 [Lysobacterales bacterium]|jgi:high frequency lysogenization protein|nr:MAG: hypothetical protein KatS3mg125_1746 [Xanthomonadales bacterium]
MTADEIRAFVGMLQAIGLVQRVANHGDGPAEAMRESLASIFVLDPRTPEEVFPGPLAFGCRTALELLERPARHRPELAMSAAVLQVERLFRRHPKLVERVGQQLRELAPLARECGPDDPRIIEALALLYQRTISTLPVRVVVKGDPRQLSRPSCIATIRALLFAALRAAVLWRQLGGRRWRLLWHLGRLRRWCRTQLARAAEEVPPLP